MKSQKQFKLKKISRHHSDENNQTFTNLAPRRGSLPADYNRPAPKTPKFPLTAPLPEEKDYSDILDELLTKGQSNSSTKILNKLLEEKENEIRRLELEKQQWLKEKEEWEREKSTHLQLQKQFANQSKELESLNKELAESNEIIYQEGQEKEKLNKFLRQKELERQKLEQKLIREVDENSWLRNSFKRTKDELTEKVEELTKLKRLGQEEKQEWQKIFTEQEEKYEIERKRREQVFNKKFNNLRTFQLTADIPTSIGRGRAGHKKAFSLSLPSSRSASPQGSLHENEISTKPKGFDLSVELNRANRFNPLTSSPLRNEDTDPFQEANPTFNFNQFDDLLNEVDGVANDNNRESELLEENQQLKENQTQLENAYKTLFDEKVEQERLLKNFNEKELIWEKEKQEYEKLLFNYTQKEQGWTIEKQSLQETLSEKDYQLAETKSKKNKAEKVIKETKEKLKEKEKSEKETIQSLKTKLLTAKQAADNLGNDIYQTQILINPNIKK